MGIIDSKKTYRAPQIELVDLNIQGVLCQDSGTGAATINDYKEDQLVW